MGTATTQQFKVIGTRPIRHDGVDKVTGRAKYGADYSFPGMLHGKVLRSPYAHARIKSINIDKALALPGVKAIISGPELPELPNRKEAIGEIVFNPRDCVHNVLARDKVLYHGHAIAAVAAASPHIAEEAVELIEVDYEPLPAVMTVEQAMAPDAQIIDPELRTPESGDLPTNIASHIQFKRGDLQAGFKAADYIVEREFTTAMVHQGYIEPHNAVGIYNSDGRATVYCSTQAPFELRAMIAQIAGLPLGDVKVVPAEIGGGFGGKTIVYLEPLAVALSRKTGAPVKMDEPRGRDACQRPRFGLFDQDQNGREARRHAHRGGGLSRLRSGGLCGFAGRRRRNNRDRVVQYRELPNRRLRCPGQSPQDAWLSGARRGQRRSRLRNCHR